MREYIRVEGGGFTYLKTFNPYLAANSRWNSEYYASCACESAGVWVYDVTGVKLPSNFTIPDFLAYVRDKASSVSYWRVA